MERNENKGDSSGSKFKSEEGYVEVVNEFMSFAEEQILSPDWEIILDNETQKVWKRDIEGIPIIKKIV